MYLTYGINYCVNIVTGKENWANGVLLRAMAIPKENERVASGPGLIARRFGLNKSHDNLKISKENGLWLVPPIKALNQKEIVNCPRIGISKAKDLEWRWYLKNSRSISKRIKGDRNPNFKEAWIPSTFDRP